MSSEWQWNSNNNVLNSEQLYHHSQAGVKRDIYHMMQREKCRNKLNNHSDDNHAHSFVRSWKDGMGKEEKDCGNSNSSS